MNELNLIVESKQKLTALCQTRLIEKGLDFPEYQDRLKYELNELEIQDEFEYFLDIADKGIKYRCNQWNLLVVYLLDIAQDFQIDNPPAEAWGDWPDVDLDILDEVRDYLKNDWAPRTFGSEYVCNICNYSYYKMRSSLLDMAKIHGVPLEESRPVSKSIPDKDDEGISLTWEKAIEINEGLAKFKEKYPDVLDATIRIHNRIKSLGKHAGGLIISGKPLNEIVPLVKDKSGMPMSAWPEGQHTQELSPVGLVKYDFLGITNLRQLAKIESLIKKRHNIDICALPGQKRWSNLSYLDDPVALKMANDGDTKAIFQFESFGMRRLVKDSGITSFNDLAALSALYRPGPLDAKMHERYVARKNGKETYEIHEKLRPFLQKTYGIMVFQEQVMQVLHVVGKVPLTHCYTLIKAISKKKLDKFARYKDKFLINGAAFFEQPDCLPDMDAAFMASTSKLFSETTTAEDVAKLPFEKGMPNPYGKAMTLLARHYKNSGQMFNRQKLTKEVAEIYAKYLWEQIQAFSGYGFNASHSVAYSYISSRLLYCKAHYPLEFYAGILSCETDEVKIREYKLDAILHGIPVNFIDINRSKAVFDIVEDQIYFGLSHVKSIGLSTAETIVKYQPYSSFEDFLVRSGVKGPAMKPILCLRMFKDAPPTDLYKYYEDFKDFVTYRADRKTRHEKKTKSQFNELLELTQACGLKDEVNPLDYWDESIPEKYKTSLDYDEIYQEICQRSQSEKFGQLVDHKYNRYKRMKALFKRHNTTIREYWERKAVEDNAIYKLEGYDPSASKKKLSDDLKPIFTDFDKAQQQFIGFLWSHPLEKSPDYTGLTFAVHREGYVIGPVEICVEAVRKIEWKNKKGHSYKVKCQDGNGETQDISVWSNDYDKFKEDFENHKLLRLRLGPEHERWGFSLESLAKGIKVPKDRDYRVLKLRRPTLD